MWCWPKRVDTKVWTGLSLLAVINNKLLTKKMTCLLAVVLAAAACPAGAATFYVSPQGSDRNSGRSVGPDKALQTIQAAVDKLQPGDTCLILGGTYRETVVFPRSGKPGRPITLKPYKGQKVIDRQRVSEG